MTSSDVPFIDYLASNSSDIYGSKSNEESRPQCGSDVANMILLGFRSQSLAPVHRLIQLCEVLMSEKRNIFITDEILQRPGQDELRGSPT